jgi:heme exporter protein D
LVTKTSGKNLITLATLGLKISQETKQILIDLLSKQPREMRQQQHMKEQAQETTIYPVVQLTTKVGLHPRC